MNLGTLAVVAVLAFIVGAIVFGWIRNKRAGVKSSCEGCGACSGGCAEEQHNHGSCGNHHFDRLLEQELLGKHHNAENSQ